MEVDLLPPVAYPMAAPRGVKRTLTSSSLKSDEQRPKRARRGSANAAPDPVPDATPELAPLLVDDCYLVIVKQIWITTGVDDTVPLRHRLIFLARVSLVSKVWNEHARRVMALIVDWLPRSWPGIGGGCYDDLQLVCYAPTSAALVPGQSALIGRPLVIRSVDGGWYAPLPVPENEPAPSHWKLMDTFLNLTHTKEYVTRAGRYVLASLLDDESPLGAAPELSSIVDVIESTGLGADFVLARTGAALLDARECHRDRHADAVKTFVAVARNIRKLTLVPHFRRRSRRVSAQPKYEGNGTLARMIWRFLGLTEDYAAARRLVLASPRSHHVAKSLSLIADRGHEMHRTPHASYLVPWLVDLAAETRDPRKTDDVGLDRFNVVRRVLWHQDYVISNDKHPERILSDDVTDELDARRDGTLAHFILRGDRWHSDFERFLPWRAAPEGPFANHDLTRATVRFPFSSLVQRYRKDPRFLATLPCRPATSGTDLVPSVPWTYCRSYNDDDYDDEDVYYSRTVFDMLFAHKLVRLSRIANVSTDRRPCTSLVYFLMCAPRRLLVKWARPAKEKTARIRHQRAVQAMTEHVLGALFGDRSLVPDNTCNALYGHSHESYVRRVRDIAAIVDAKVDLLPFVLDGIRQWFFEEVYLLFCIACPGGKWPWQPDELLCRLRAAILVDGASGWFPTLCPTTATIPSAAPTASGDETVTTVDQLLTRLAIREAKHYEKPSDGYEGFTCRLLREGNAPGDCAFCATYRNGGAARGGVAYACMARGFAHFLDRGDAMDCSQ